MENVRGWRGVFRRSPAIAVNRTVGESLTGFIGRFVAENASTEGDFVSLGRTLRQLYTSATELTGLVQQRAAGLRTALENSRLTGEQSISAHMLAEVHSTLEEASRLLDSLSDVGKALNDLQVGAHSIKRIGVHLSSSVYSFAIESCRTPDCQHAFSAFVSELRTLSTNVTLVADDISREVRNTHESQSRTVQELSTGLQGIRQLSREIEATSQASAAEAQRLLDHSLASLHEAEDCTREIARHADEAVYHLQFGDIIRQKVEHIAAALREAAELLYREPSGADKTAVEQVLAIQISQLESVHEEVLQAHTKLTACFQSIARETHRLATALTDSQRSSGDHSGAKDTLDEFAAHTRRMEGLQREGKRLGSQALAAAAQAAAASTQLAGHFDRVNAINVEMHLQALNAIVKTAALGRQGATLEVLSSQVDRLFRESSQEVHGITRTLGRIQPYSDEFLAAHATVEQGGTGSARSEVSAGLEAIGAAYMELSSTAAQAENLANEEEAWLAENRHHLDFLESLAECFSGHVRDLEMLRAQLAPWASDSTPPTDASLAALDQRYTMQSEREIHARVSQGKDPLAAAALSEPRPDDNVELFDAQPQTDVCVPHAAASETATEPDKKRETASVAAASADNSLGDNIELF